MSLTEQPLARFAERLFESGEVIVQRELTPPDTADLDTFDGILLRFYREDRQRLPLRVPPLDPEAGRWAGQLLYRACQLLERRDIASDQVRDELLTPFPSEITASVVYSTDLLLRYLRDLDSLAKGLAPGDELVVCLRRLGADWPFSSVGMRELPPLTDLTPIARDDALRLAYCDRIIDCRDTDRLQPQWVRETIREALGNHHHLWPDFDHHAATI